MEIDEEVTSELKPKTYQSVLNEKKKKERLWHRRYFCDRTK